MLFMKSYKVGNSENRRGVRGWEDIRLGANADIYMSTFHNTVDGETLEDLN